jgi:hypothetical protein
MTGAEIRPVGPIHPLLTEREYKDKINVSRTRRKAMKRMMRDITRNLKEEGLTTRATRIHKGQDVHCFFSIPDNPNKVIHFQLYSNKQNLTTADIRIREMDPRKFAEARKLASTGYEESAVTKPILKRVPALYTQNSITEVLRQVLSAYQTTTEGSLAGELAQVGRFAHGPQEVPQLTYVGRLRGQLLEQYQSNR